MKKRTFPILSIICVILTMLLLVGSFFVGKYPLTLSDLLHKEPMALRAFYTLRVPRVFLGAIGGFCLGVTGFVFQTIFRNPLAAPDIIGVTSGASAGAAFAILYLGATPFALTSSAFVGGVLALLCALLLAKLSPTKQQLSIVLSGIAVHALAQTVLMFLKLLSDPEKQLASIEYWIMGSLSGKVLSDIPIPLLISISAVILLLLLHRQTLLLSLGDEESFSLGVNVSKLRLLLLALATLSVAGVISLTGLISFLSLLAPHVARLLTGRNHMGTVLLSGVLGSDLLLIADMFARSAPSELPVSIFTSLVGVPCLIYLLLRKENSI